MASTDCSSLHPVCLLILLTGIFTQHTTAANQRPGEGRVYGSGRKVWPELVSSQGEESSSVALVLIESPLPDPRGLSSHNELIYSQLNTDAAGADSHASVSSTPHTRTRTVNKFTGQRSGANCQLSKRAHDAYVCACGFHCNTNTMVPLVHSVCKVHNHKLSSISNQK